MVASENQHRQIDLWQMRLNRVFLSGGNDRRGGRRIEEPKMVNVKLNIVAQSFGAIKLQCSSQGKTERRAHDLMQMVGQGINHSSGGMAQ